MSAAVDTPRRHRLLMLLLFVGGGFAALVYEVVWLQMLQLVIGSSTVSVGVLLGTFMGGLCLGSVGASAIGRARHPLRVYAALEATVGVCAIGLVPLIPAVGGVYGAWSGTGGSAIVLRAAIAALCLLPPTVAMGATLPTVGRWVKASPGGLAWLGVFYAGNTLGSVAGALAAAFYLLRVFDVIVATAVAAGVNLMIAAAAWALAARSRPSAAGGRAHAVLARRESPPASRPEPASLRILAVAALSGFAALAAEVVWTRHLSLLFGGTVYTFAIILAIFLAALAVGSGGGAWLAGWVRRPVLWLAAVQLAAVIGVAYSAFMLAEILPRQPAPIADAAGWRSFLRDLWRAGVAIWPAPLLWGATFPLALAAAARPREPRRDFGEDETREAGDAGRLTGHVYAANTVGAIIGALTSSLVLVAAIGTQQTQRVIMAAGAIAAVLAGTAVAHRASHAVRRGLAAAIVAVVAAAAVPPVPAMLVAYGRHTAAWFGHAGEFVFVGEGRQASVAVSRAADGALHYHNAGKVQASSLPQDMRLQRMLGHLTTIVPQSARKVLVIGCGAGVTAGAVAVSPRVERVTIVEIEPLVPREIATRFASVNHDVIANPKVAVVIDDARHFLATTNERFDAITSDPLDPWVKGAAALYTREFFELARDRLAPGGVVTLFVQLYESSPAAVKSEMATFFDVFPEGLVFGNVFDGHAEDTVLVGGRGPLRLDVDRLERDHVSTEYALVRRSLGEIGIYSIVDLLGQYAGRAAELRPWLADAQITRDRNLRLQYLAGMSLNQHLGRGIYSELLQFRRFPSDLFLASEPNLSWLRAAIEQPPE